MARIARVFGLQAYYGFVQVCWIFQGFELTGKGRTKDKKIFGAYAKKDKSGRITNVRVLVGDEIGGTAKECRVNSFTDEGPRRLVIHTEDLGVIDIGKTLVNGSPVSDVHLCTPYQL